MFPYSQYSCNLNTFQPNSQLIYQNLETNNSFTPTVNYYYFPNSSLFHPNLNYVPYFQPTYSTHTSDENFSSCKPFLAMDSIKTNGNPLNKNHFLSPTSEKMGYENRFIQKTKRIQKKCRGIPLPSDAVNLKSKKEKNHSKSNESEYSAEEETKKKPDDNLNLFLKYRRKNTESNIVNRIHSFLTSEFKNKHQLNKFKFSQTQKQTYLKYLMTVIDSWKGPVKRQLLLSLMTASETLPAYKVLQKMFETEKVLSLKEFGYLNRVLIKTYLSKIATISIITSKKMKRSVWKQHLEKIRQLNSYFFEIQNNNS